jgi:hypothetical protein
MIPYANSGSQGRRTDDDVGNEQMQGMMNEMSEMMKGGAMRPEQRRRTREMMGQMGGLHGMMAGPGPGTAMKWTIGERRRS